MAIMKINPVHTATLGAFFTAAATTAVWPYLPAGDKICRPTTAAKTEYEVIGSLNRQRLLLAPMLQVRDEAGDRVGFAYVFPAQGHAGRLGSLVVKESRQVCELNNPSFPEFPLKYTLTGPGIRFW